MTPAIVSALDRGIDHVAHILDDPRIDYEKVWVVSSWLSVAFEVWLYRRQLSQYNKTSPPPELASHLSDETFRKAQAYGRDKTRFEVFKVILNQLSTWAQVHYRWMPKLWDVTAGWMTSLGMSQSRVIIHQILWLGVLVYGQSLMSLPVDYYATFFIEAKHGFNKSTKKLWVMDKIKGFLLTGVILAPLISALLKIIEVTGKAFVPWLMLFMVVVQLVMQIVYPAFIQPLFNKLTALPEGELRTRVEKMAGTLGFPLKHLYVIDGSKRSSHSNAYFYGIPFGSKHIVIYDTLIEKSSPAEVEAVLGHELGHWYYSHPAKLLLVAESHLLFIFTVFAAFIHNRTLYRSYGFDPRLATGSPVGGPQPFLIGLMLFLPLLEPLDTPVNFGMHALTRRYEYQADEFAIKMDKKDDLGSCLIKLHIDNLSSPHNDKLYSMYHHSHPTLPERLRAMDEFAAKHSEEKSRDSKKEL